MEIDPDVRHILSAALRAPSGDNNQPWQWIVRGNRLELWYVSDESASGIFVRADQVSLGAALESACIAATQHGYKGEVELHSGESKHRATITLVKDASIMPDQLANYIEKRVTNRLPYSKRPLTKIEYAELNAAVASSHHCTFHMLTDRRKMERVARASTVYDAMIFSHQTIHDHFFKTISWTKREDRVRRTGFYYPTLGAPPHMELLFRMTQYWGFQRFLDVLRYPAFVAWSNGNAYLRAGAFCALSMKNTSIDDYIEAGRTIMRLWLTITRLGLSMQPISGLLYLDLSLFSDEEKTKVIKATRDISREFRTDDTVMFVFRIGRSRRPRFQSTRKRFEDVVKVADFSSGIE